MAGMTNDNIIRANIAETEPIRANMSTIPCATEEVKGKIRIATQQEAIEGVDALVAITPHTLRMVTYYEHEQAIANNVWVIKHNLNKYPSCCIVDSSGNVQCPNEIIYNSNNEMTLEFLSAFAGYAYLN